MKDKLLLLLKWVKLALAFILRSIEHVAAAAAKALEE